MSEPRNDHGAFRYQSVYVAVPKAVREKYWHLPWATVKAAGDDGVDGLRVVGRPRYWGGCEAHGTPQEPDVAFLCEGQGTFIGKTVLFQQNW